MKDRTTLEGEGWVRCGIFCEPRLSELVALYQELGYDVLLRPLDSSELDDALCQECFARGTERYRVLYTHRRGASSCK